MRKRAEDVERTRQRIVEAAVQLHGTVGPAATTISALAEEAGVTRVTVYRHFPDEDALFRACSTHWAAQQHLPDPVSWMEVDDPVERLRVGLTDVYRFYRDGEAMLSRVYRDRAALPESMRRSLEEDEAQFRDILLGAFELRGAARRCARALIGHAVSFWTWRSLCVGQGLSNQEAIDAMVALVVGQSVGTAASR